MTMNFIFIDFFITYLDKTKSQKGALNTLFVANPVSFCQEANWTKKILSILLP